MQGHFQEPRTLLRIFGTLYAFPSEESGSNFSSSDIVPDPQNVCALRLVLLMAQELSIQSLLCRTLLTGQTQTSGCYNLGAALVTP